MHLKSLCLETKKSGDLVLDQDVANNVFRIKLQNEAFKICNNTLWNFLKKYKSFYLVNNTSNPYNYELSNLDKLFKDIIEDSIINNLKPLNEVFSKKCIERSDYKYNIDFANKHIKSSFIKLTSNTIRKPSFCIGLVIYQVKWGIILLFTAFMLDWDGKKDSIIKNIIKCKYPLLLELSSFKYIEQIEFNFFEELDRQVEYWNKMRAEEINQFNNLKE